MSRYLIPHHVYPCVTSDGVVVLLDLKRNSYLSLRGGQEAIGALLEGWPMPEGASSSREAQPDSQGIEMLLKRGLLTNDRVGGKSAQPATLERGEVSLIGTYGSPPRIRPHHALNLAIACAIGTWQWRCCSLESAVRRVAARKARGRREGAAFDLSAVREMARVFFYLRPYFYTAAGHCLFDSLVLVEFFARYEMYPTLVVGVRTAPFRAHSWVQERGYVFNDTPEHTRSLTPIVTV